MTTVQEQSAMCQECLKARRENVKLWHNTNGRSGVSFVNSESVFCYYHQKAKNHEDLGTVPGR